MGADQVEERGDSRLLSDDMSRELRSLGFESGWPVMELGGLDFGIDEIFGAFIATTYIRPVSVPFIYEQRVGDQDYVWHLDTVPHLVQAVYVQYQVGLDDRPIGCHEHPKWYIRGHIAHGVSNPEPQLIDRVHVLLEMMETGADAKIDICMYQLVRSELFGSDPGAPLQWLDGSKAPGQQ